MLTTTVIGLLLGGGLGARRVNFLLFIAALLIAVVGVAAVEIIQASWGHGVVTAFVISVAIQSGYLAAALLNAVLRPTSAVDFEGSIARDEMILNIRERMEVVGSDGRHVGIIDHKESLDRIILSKDDPAASGRRHLIWPDWVAYVDRQVHLNRSYRQVTAEWLTA